MSATGQSRSPAPTLEAQRMRDAFEKHEFGVALYRQRMRREHPQSDKAEIEAMTRAWVISPPRPDRLRCAWGTGMVSAFDAAASQGVRGLDEVEAGS